MMVARVSSWLRYGLCLVILTGVATGVTEASAKKPPQTDAAKKAKAHIARQFMQGAERDLLLGKSDMHLVTDGSAANDEIVLTQGDVTHRLKLDPGPSAHNALVILTLPSYISDAYASVLEAQKQSALLAACLTTAPTSLAYAPLPPALSEEERTQLAAIVERQFNRAAPATKSAHARKPLAEEIAIHQFTENLALWIRSIHEGDPAALAAAQAVATCERLTGLSHAGIKNALTNEKTHAPWERQVILQFATACFRDNLCNCSGGGHYTALASYLEYLRDEDEELSSLNTAQSPLTALTDILTCLATGNTNRYDTRITSASHYLQIREDRDQNPYPYGINIERLFAPVVQDTSNPLFDDLEAMECHTSESKEYVQQLTCAIRAGMHTSQHAMVAMRTSELRDMLNDLARRAPEPHIGETIRSWGNYLEQSQDRGEVSARGQTHLGCLCYAYRLNNALNDHGFVPFLDPLAQKTKSRDELFNAVVAASFIGQRFLLRPKKQAATRRLGMALCDIAILNGHPTIQHFRAEHLQKRSVDIDDSGTARYHRQEGDCLIPQYDAIVAAVAQELTGTPAGVGGRYERALPPPDDHPSAAGAQRTASARAFERIEEVINDFADTDEAPDLDAAIKHFGGIGSIALQFLDITNKKDHPYRQCAAELASLLAFINENSPPLAADALTQTRTILERFLPADAPMSKEKTEFMQTFNGMFEALASNKETQSFCQAVQDLDRLTGYHPDRMAQALTSTQTSAPEKALVAFFLAQTLLRDGQSAPQHTLTRPRILALTRALATWSKDLDPAHVHPKVHGTLIKHCAEHLMLKKDQNIAARYGLPRQGGNIKLPVLLQDVAAICGVPAPNTSSPGPGETPIEKYLADREETEKAKAAAAKKKSQRPAHKQPVQRPAKKSAPLALAQATSADRPAASDETEPKKKSSGTQPHVVIFQERATLPIRTGAHGQSCSVQTDALLRPPMIEQACGESLGIARHDMEAQTALLSWGRDAACGDAVITVVDADAQTEAVAAPPVPPFSLGFPGPFASFNPNIALYNAAITGNGTVIEQLLADKRFEETLDRTFRVTNVYGNGLTALHGAAIAGCLKGAKRLIEARFDPNAMSSTGLTPLFFAALLHPTNGLLLDLFEGSPTSTPPSGMPWLPAPYQQQGLGQGGSSASTPMTPATVPYSSPPHAGLLPLQSPLSPPVGNYGMRPQTHIPPIWQPQPSPYQPVDGLLRNHVIPGPAYSRIPKQH